MGAAAGRLPVAIEQSRLIRLLVSRDFILKIRKIRIFRMVPLQAGTNPLC
jgi:hypothetical protein